MMMLTIINLDSSNPLKILIILISITKMQATFPSSPLIDTFFIKMFMCLWIDWKIWSNYQWLTHSIEYASWYSFAFAMKHLFDISRNWMISFATCYAMLFWNIDMLFSSNVLRNASRWHCRLCKSKNISCRMQKTNAFLERMFKRFFVMLKRRSLSSFIIN